MESNSRFFFRGSHVPKESVRIWKNICTVVSVSGSMATFQPLSSVKKSRPRSTKTYMGVAIAIESFPGGKVSTQTLWVSNRKPQKGLGFGGWNLGPKFSDLWRIQATFSKYHSLLKVHSRIISLKKKISFSAKEFKSSNHVPPGFSIFKSPRIRKIPKADFFGDFGGDSLTFHHHLLGGGWTNPSEKYSSNCILSPRIGMKIKNI